MYCHRFAVVLGIISEEIKTQVSFRPGLNVAPLKVLSYSACSSLHVSRGLDLLSLTASSQQCQMLYAHDLEGDIAVMMSREHPMKFGSVMKGA